VRGEPPIEVEPGPGLLAGAPAGTVPVPTAVVAAAAGDDLRPVWRNQLGGLTFEIDPTGPRRRFAKWAPAATALDLPGEATRLRWARAFVTVPEPIDLGTDADGTWLVTTALAGRSAVDPRWRDDPTTACRALGAGLRALHDALPVDHCPFSWSVADRIARAGIDAALVGDPPPVDRLVVAHGDACAPNTLLADDGRVTGQVDLGAMGVAHRNAVRKLASSAVDQS
jgi:kanamycin kinase